MSHENNLLIITVISMTVLLVGYAARARSWGIGLMFVGIVGTLSIIVYRIYMAIH